MKNIIFCILFAFICAISGESCENAQVESVTFTTDDAVIVTKVAYIAEFTVQCSNGIKDISLYAETEAGIFPVARTLDGSRYQVSWTEDTNQSYSGEKRIRLFDEVGFSALRKAQRNEENTEAIKPVSVISLYHPGAYKGVWIQTETLALLGIIAIYYYAYSQKAIIMA